MNIAACYLLGQELAIALQDNLNGGAWFTAQFVGHLFGVLTWAVHAVHFDKSIAWQESCFLRGHAFIEFVDIDIAIAVHDDTTYAAVLALCHTAQFVVFTFGDI